MLIPPDSLTLKEDYRTFFATLKAQIMPALSIVGKLKGKAAYFIRQEFSKKVRKKLWGEHFWSPSYCVVSCGGAPLEIVKKYIENQRRPLI